jgi:predicted O-methyltransferase YrrM
MTLPEPYNSVDLLPFDAHGWLALENRRNLKRFIKSKSPKKVVELGSWLGASARLMGSLLPSDAKLYCVDTWLGTHVHQAEPFYKGKLPTLYQQFLSNVIHAKLTDIIVPLRMTTREAVDHIDDGIDLIYVDADHSKEGAYNDIMDWYPKLSEGGIICGDDYAHDHPGVIAATHLAKKELGCQLRNDKRFWWFTPK